MATRACSRSYSGGSFTQPPRAGEAGAVMTPPVPFIRWASPAGARGARTVAGGGVFVGRAVRASWFRRAEPAFITSRSSRPRYALGYQPRSGGEVASSAGLVSTARAAAELRR